MDYNIYKRNPFRFPKMLTPDVPSVSFVFCRIKKWEPDRGKTIFWSAFGKFQTMIWRKVTNVFAEY